MKRVLVFANPIAGSGRGKAVAELVADGLTAAGYGVALFFDRADAAPFRQEESCADAAVIIGGDGTLRAVAQRILGRSGTGPFPYPLLVVPMGTANLMGRHLGIRWTGRDVSGRICAALANGCVTHLDVASAAGGLMLMVAGVGLDGSVVHELARGRRGPITLWHYLGPILRATADYHFPSITVRVDERSVFGPAPALALVGNIREYGAGFPILPDARPDDGLLDVCVMPCASRSDLLRLAMAAAAGEHVHEEGVVYLKGRRVFIDSPQWAAVQVDGEPAGLTPLDIRLLPCRIPFIVPPDHPYE